MKKLQIMILIGLLLVSTAAIAGANYIHYKVDAVDRGIKVIVDGKQRAVTTTPIMIDDKVMISLRDAATIFNKSVSWDANNNLVTVGKNTIISKPANTVAFKYIEEMTVIRNVGPFYQPERAIAVAGKTFPHGVVVDLDASKDIQKVPIGDKAFKVVAEAKILLNKNYYAMDGSIAVEDWSMNGKAGFTMRVYADNVLLYQSPLIQPAELPKFLNKTAFGSLSNVNILKIELEQQAMAVPGETSITKAALGNFKFYKKH